MSIERLEQVWPEWHTEALLGEGAFGKVYRAMREEHGVTTYAAIKVLSIPQSDAELSSLRSEGYSEGAMKTYFQGIIVDFANEIKLMQTMKGNSNVVSVEDFRVLEKADKVGWDIYIRMELLTSFNEYISDRKLDEAEVIKIGEDILGALELCAHRKVIHRDIKPENIFISQFGSYKLGDFGIARELEKTSGSMSQKGTYSYIAPEVAAGRHYDATVDTYSLGLILYRLLNNNRLPFLDANAQVVQYQDRKSAVDRRLNGEPLPAPADASHSMAQVVLKACAFNPADRYQSPTEFKNALETVKNGGNVPDFERTELLEASGTVQLNNMPQPNPAAQRKKKPPVTKSANKGAAKGHKKPLAIGIAIVVIAALAVGGYFSLTRLIAANNANRVIEALENQDYTGAFDAFNNKIDGSSIAVLESQLSRRLDLLKSEYTSERIEYNAVIMELDTVRRFNIMNLSAKISDLEQYTINLNDSRVAFSLAATLHEAGDYVGAIEQYKLVSMEDSNYNKARDGLTAAVADYKRNALDEAALLAENQNYSSAIRLLDRVMENVGNDADLARQRDVYEKQGIGDRIDKAKSLADNGDFSAASSELRALDIEYPNNTSVRMAISDVAASHATAIVLQASELAAKPSYTEAIKALNDGLRLYPDSDSLKNALAVTQNEYATYSTGEADKLVEEEKYEEAVALLTEAQNAMPGNTIIATKLQAVEDVRPKPLFSVVEAYESTNFKWFSVVSTSSFSMAGVAYNYGFTIENYGYNAYALFNLGGKYESLEFTLGHMDGRYMRDAAINIYLDGEHSQSILVSASALPNKVIVPLNNAMQLKIACTDYNAHFGFADPVIR
ncbi:MAG: protein kinase [Lachnospiraceae bacterium]|jgi:serine/threonine protein kinase|nr:protein kinase [Lachnospiraceae bacterium]